MQNAQHVEVANAGQEMANPGHVPDSRHQVEAVKPDTAPMCRAGLAGMTIGRSWLFRGRPLEQRSTSGGKAGNSTFATPGDGAGSDTRNLRGVMPNSPSNSLDLLTCHTSFLDWRAGPIQHYTAVENNYGLRKYCRIWEGGIPCFFRRWSSAAPAVAEARAACPRLASS